MYYPGRKEGQFDIGLVNRWRQRPGRRFRQLQVDRFQPVQQRRRSRTGVLPVGLRVQPRPRRRIRHPRLQELRRAEQRHAGARARSCETYARVVNQQGVNFLFGTWGDASISRATWRTSRCAKAAAMPGPAPTSNWSQPVSEHVAFTVDGGYNETFVRLRRQRPTHLRSRVRQLHQSEGIRHGHHSGADGRPAHPLRIRHAPRRQQPANRRCRSEPVGVTAGNHHPERQRVRTIRSACALTYQWTQITGTDGHPLQRQHRRSPPSPRPPDRPTASA